MKIDILSFIHPTNLCLPSTEYQCSDGTVKKFPSQNIVERYFL